MLLHLALSMIITAGQAGTPAIPQTPPTTRAGGEARNALDDTSSLAAAWTALADGRHAEASRLADALLKREPWNHPARIIKLRAVAATDGAVPALDHYEEWLKNPRAGRGNDDIYLLDPVVVTFLKELSWAPRMDIRVGALSRLAEFGLGASRDALEALHEQGGPLVDAELARLGDADALARLRTSAVGPGDQRLAVEALAAQGRASVPALLEVLQASSDSLTQASAAKALGSLGATEGLPILQGLFNSQNPYVRASAAVALSQIGDQNGREYVDKMLVSDIPDLRIMAAQAAADKPGPWLEAVRPLLENQDGLIRLDAARLLARFEPDAAAGVLAAALQDRNPVVRAESARRIKDLAGSGVEIISTPSLRSKLRDPDAETRLHAASTLLSWARPVK